MCSLMRLWHFSSKYLVYISGSGISHIATHLAVLVRVVAVAVGQPSSKILRSVISDWRNGG